VAHILAGSRFNVVASIQNLGDVRGTRKLKNSTCVALIGVDENPAVILLEASRLRQEIADLRIVALARESSPEEVLAAIESGADAYLCKDVTAEFLIKSLELVLLGPLIVTNGLLVHTNAGSLDNAHPTQRAAGTEPLISGNHYEAANALSTRQEGVLTRLTRGWSNKEIAHDLGIPESAVKFHVRILLRKIGAKNRTQAVMWAFATRRIPHDDGV
jgi:two-component system nitrate/nitrite response regulator NarL